MRSRKIRWQSEYDRYLIEECQRTTPHEDICHNLNARFSLALTMLGVESRISILRRKYGINIVPRYPRNRRYAHKGTTGKGTMTEIIQEQ